MPGRPLCVLLLSAACVAKPTYSDTSGAATTADGNTTAVMTGGALTVDVAPTTTGTTGTSATSTSTTTGTTGGPPLVCPPPPCENDNDCAGGSTCIDPMEDFDDESNFQKYCYPPYDPNTDGCDAYAQDCPTGFKCVHQIFDSTGPGCVPVQHNPSPPESACEKLPACLVDEYGHGIYPDTCDVGSQCHGGTCQQFCTLVDGIPTCPAGYACNSGRVSLWCLKTCDPLVQECPPDEICSPDYNVFFCTETFPDPSQLFESCAGEWDCAYGLTCVDKSAGVECPDTDLGCCVPFCDLGAPIGASSCPGEGQTCLPWFWTFDPKPEFAHIGYCSIPP